MAIACPIDLDTQKLRDEIRSIYSRVAADPTTDFHFHRGPEYAAEFLGYDRSVLAELPEQSTASFAGVANPHRMGPIGEGKVVVDIGCGAGMDLLFAAKSIGPRGRAIGIDMTEAMREKALSSARSAGLDNVEVRLGDAMSLPLDDESVDVVISNGVLNLVPDKSVAYGEAFRVLKPGGRFLYSDIVVGSELSESIRRNIDLWTGWIAGALPEGEMIELLSRIGFQNLELRERFDPFRGTSKEKIARQFGVMGVNVYAQKPEA